MADAKVGDSVIVSGMNPQTGESMKKSIGTVALNQTGQLLGDGDAALKKWRTQAGPNMAVAYGSSRATSNLRLARPGESLADTETEITIFTGIFGLPHRVSNE
jgi:hypothetical protein